MYQFREMQDKQTLREKNRKIRATLVESGEILGITARIIMQIIEKDYFKNAKNVMVYYPLEGEVDLLPLLELSENSDKTFYLPRCEGNGLEICPFAKDDNLKLGMFRIYEPETQELEDLSILDVIFIPALGADKFGNRIGYGKGYYDEFFNDAIRNIAKKFSAKKVVVLPRALLCEQIRCEEHDVEYDDLITD